MLWIPAYVGIGSNLADPLTQVRNGFDLLTTLPETLLVARSDLYRSAPLGPQNQPDFVNAVAGLLTHLAPERLLRELKQLEIRMGREQAPERWGPRLIDFDLLVYGDARIASAAITIPHPGIPERAFVLYPLMDVAPQLDIPGLGPIADLSRRVTSTGIQKL